MRLILISTILLISLGKLHAFLPETDLLTIYPAVAKAGSSVEVRLTGKDLEAITGLYFTDPRIKAQAVMLPADEYHPKARALANRFKVTIPADVKPGVYEVRALGYFGLSTARPFLVITEGSTEALEEGNHSTKETAMPLPLETGMTGSMSNKAIDWYKITAKKVSASLFNYGLNDSTLKLTA